MSAVLKRITTRAKQIYKKGKAGISWVASIKRASAQVTGKRKGPSLRAKRSKRRIGKGPTITPTRKIVLAGIGRIKRRKRVSSLRAKRSKLKPISSRYKNEVKQKLSKALLDYELADTIKATKEAQKRKIKFRKVLRALK